VGFLAVFMFLSSITFSSSPICALGRYELSRTVSQPPPAFKVDRPFMVFLVDNQCGAILFIARVNDLRE
jgi:serine protease inhibitor